MADASLFSEFLAVIAEEDEDGVVPLADRLELLDDGVDEEIRFAGGIEVPVVEPAVMLIHLREGPVAVTKRKFQDRGMRGATA